MKKLLVLFSLMATVTMASAQESKIMAGGGLTYATEIKNIGINIKGLYLINEKWEADAGFTYFFEKNYTKWSALDFNGHYVFVNNDGKALYALAGLNMTFYKFEIDGVGIDPYDDYYGGTDEYPEYMDEFNPMASLAGDLESKGSEIGVNIGIGGRMPISSALSLNGEVKYTLGGADYLSINAGILYHF